MSQSSWYEAGAADDVTAAGHLAGWVGTGTGYGSSVKGGFSYRFGPVLNGWGTWGQLVFDNQSSLVGQDMSNPSGLNNVMPTAPAPDGAKWIQGHLVNGECGGDGGLAANLAPISNRLNMQHKKFESVIKMLCNRGASGNSMISHFRPTGPLDCRIIYRTHRLPPLSIAKPAIVGTSGSHPHLSPDLPSGIRVSLGIVNGGKMLSAAELETEFKNPKGLFSDYFRKNKTLTDTLLALIAGKDVAYI